MSAYINISDSLATQAEETAKIIERIAEQFDIPFDAASKVVQIAAMSQLNNTLYHAKCIIDESHQHHVF